MDSDSAKPRPRGWNGWPSGLVIGVVLGVVTGVIAAQNLCAVSSPSPWPSYATTFAAVAPSVVQIAVDGPETRIGTGFSVSDHEVVTARHIVFDAATVSVTGWDGGVRTARVVGTDARTDLALLSVDGAPLTPAVLGRSAGLQVGDAVVAVGNPYGLGHSLSVGVVGHRGRRLVVEAADGPRVDFLQLAIPLNPGNSGGPIFDAAEQVIGVLSGTHTQGQAIAFAVPVEALIAGLPALRSGARISRAFLGVRTEQQGRSLVVLSVIPSGPAQWAGIRAGDVITAIDGEAVSTPAQLHGILDRLEGGSRTTMRLLRDGQLVLADIELADWAEQPVVVGGMTLRPQPGSGGQVVAVRPRSRAERAGIDVGDVVRTVNGLPVQAPADIKDALAGGAAVQIEVLRVGRALTVKLEEAG